MNMKIAKKLIRGFSLIEILIYIGLLSIFLFILTDLFVASLDIRLETEATSPVEQDGRYIISKLRYDIMQADSILVPSSVGLSGNTLQISDSGITYIYSVDNGDLLVSDGINQVQLNTDGTTVTSINFTRIGNPGGKNTITTAFTIESTTQRHSGAEVRSFNTTFGIR